MKNQNKSVEICCNIIRDLMPSYLDDICSEESKLLIQNHIAECQGCRESLNQLEKTEIVSEKNDVMEIDYLKKIRKYYGKKNGIVLGILIGLLGVGYFVANQFYGKIPAMTYAFVLPVLIVGCYLAVFEGEKREQAEKRDKVLAGTGIVLVAYAVILSWMCTRWVENTTYPFGLWAHEIGVFVDVQLNVIFVLQLIIFLIGTFWCKRRSLQSCLMVITSLTAIAIALGMKSIMGNLASPEGFQEAVTKLLGVLLIEGFLLGGSLLMRQRNVKIREL